MAGIGVMIFGLTLVCLQLGYSSQPQAQKVSLALMFIMFLGNIAIQMKQCAKTYEG
jgi:hypothetical protein